MEMYNDDASLEGPGYFSSTENLVKSSPGRRRKRPYYSDYGTDEDMLARAVLDSDEDERDSKTSYI